MKAKIGETNDPDFQYQTLIFQNQIILVGWNENIPMGQL